MKVIAANLISLRDNAKKIRNTLEEAIKKELPEYTDSLKNCIANIDDALKKTQLPEYYKVAIIGRFKVGKSSFVNAITNTKLASIDTNPETAAISVFRYAESTYAEIELISKEEWAKMREIYKSDKDDPSVERYSNFLTFDNKKQNIHLHEIEEEWLKSKGHIYRINAPNWETKEGIKNFRKDIQRFTSSTSPLHCMVNKIIIYAPIPLLQDNIELIDTPGLDDPKRFRVKLTEDIVKEVDAILYLTPSGASYSQSDKDFIIQQLLQGQIKNLQIIVTKVDITYDAKLMEAEDDEEQPPSFDDFKQEERKRIESEIKTTLDEILIASQTKDKDESYFKNQIDNLHIHFVTTNYRTDNYEDKSGIPTVTDKLYEILSNSYRLEQYKKILLDSLVNNLYRLNSCLGSRLDAIEKEYDAGKVKAEIETIRKSINTQLDVFKSEITDEIQLLREKQQNLKKHLPNNFKLIISYANQVLDELEKQDLATNWNSRKSGKWGNLEDLNNKIANNIFPVIMMLLRDYIEQLSNFLTAISTQIKNLRQAVLTIEQSNKLSGLDPLYLSSCQDRVVRTLEQKSIANIDNQKREIINQINHFVNSEVKNKIQSAKQNVTKFHGIGTTKRQNEEINNFYTDVKSLLSNTLTDYLENKITNFSEFLLREAEAIEPEIAAELNRHLQQRLDAIQSNLSLKTSRKKELVRAYLTELHNYCNQELSQLVEIE